MLFENDSSLLLMAFKNCLFVSKSLVNAEPFRRDISCMIINVLDSWMEMGSFL